MSSPREGGLAIVKILRTEHCCGAPATVELVRQVAAELGVSMHLEEVVIRTLSQAQDLQFVGSPTVRINDLDIDSRARGIGYFGFA